MEVNNMPSGRLTSRTSVFISHKPLLRLKYTYIYIYAQSHVHQKVCLSLLASMFCGERFIYIYIYIYIFGCFWGLWVMPEKIDDV